MTLTLDRPATIDVTPILRPNGKVYRARAAVRAHSWENLDTFSGDEQGLLVLGTHDLERAQNFANEMVAYWYGSNFPATLLSQGWFRLGYQYGDIRWVADELTGRPGFSFQTAESSRAQLAA
jgi:hypothetical protein